MKKKSIYKFISLFLLTLTCSILYINHFSYVDNSSNSQQEQLLLKNLGTAAQFEYDEKFGTINDTSSIQIELPDLTWNITEIELNFTNISQHRQIRTIESNISVSSFKEIYYSKNWNYRRRYGQQINFSEPTEVYGVYLYGFKTYITTEIVYVRLTGFDDSNNKPNNTVYHTQLINISNVLGWYYQDFSSSSLTFYKDDYYLLIDGEDVWGSDPRYHLGYNTMSPTYPSLWECETNHVSGMDDYVTYQGQPFMCKICQKVHKTYFPKELEKQAIIDENYYDIINGTQPGEGNLSLTLLNFKPDNIFLDIPIVINDDNLELIYNVSYYIKLRKPISVLIIEVGSSDKGNDSKISTGIAPEIFFIIISLIIISFIGAITSYQAIKRIIIKREEFRKKIFNKYMDVLNLKYIIVSDKNSGLCIYEQTISDKSINSTLVSGFLQAISSFGIELTGSDEQSQTIKLEYQKLKIIMSEYKNYRIINIFEDNPSEEFTEALGPLSHELDKNYGKFLENFEGDLSQFKGINSLIEKHLQISLIYPLKIVLSDNLKLNKSEKSIVQKASDIMKKNNADHFYISYLITEREFNPKRAEIILKLIDKKVFQHTI